MKRIALALAFAFFSAALAGAYDKIDFKGIITRKSLKEPVAVALCGGRILISDSDEGKVFMFEGKKMTGEISENLREPSGIGCGKDKFYVADSRESKIKVFDKKGKFLWQFASKGSLPGQLKSPESVCVGPNGMVYVANTGNERVEIYNEDGIFIKGFKTSAGEREISPAKIVVDRALNIYASDKKGRSIFKYDYDGKFVKEIKVNADSFSVDDYGFIYAADSGEGKIREVNPEGETVGIFGTKGKGKTEFRELSDIFAGDGRLLIADEGNAKVIEIAIENSMKTKKLNAANLPGFFNVKGPLSVLKRRASVFNVLPGGELVAYMPEHGEMKIAGEKTEKIVARRGKEQGQVRKPGDIFVGEKKIYVVDTGNDRVQVFNHDGSFVNMFGGSGGFFGKDKEGKFSAPKAVAVNSNKRIYVADTGNKRVQAFNEDGIFLFVIGPQIKNITLEEPVSLAVDEKDNVYILDANLKKVVVTDSSGKLVKVWDDSGRLLEPRRIEYGDRGFFYVLDRGNYNVKVFDRDGNFINSFFAKGEGSRELSEPVYLHLSKGEIWLSDIEKGRISKFGIKYMPASPRELAVKIDGKKANITAGGPENEWIKEYRIYRAGESRDYELLGAAGKDGVYSDENLAAGSTYYYVASAVSLGGDEGPFSRPRLVYVKPSGQAVKIGGAKGKNISPIEIKPAELDYIFSANYKYYTDNPLGKIVLVNNTGKSFDNVKISFSLKNFMDFPTDAIVENLPAHSEVQVPLKGSLNNNVLVITEDTPVQAQLTATYYDDGKEQKFTLNSPVKVLSKNAIIWDRPERLANFITPKDTPVFAFSRFVLKERDEFEKAGILNENLQKLALLWAAMEEYGISYLQDPVNPYSQIKSSSAHVLDTVQFPRDTLKLRSGDCDDLTALLASLLEASGVHTALLDYPAHISLMIDSEKTEAAETGFPEEYLVKHEGTWWIGVETTMVGKNLVEAVKHQAVMKRQNEDSVRVVDVRKAWSDFEPVTLTGAEFGEMPDKDKFEKRAEKVIGQILEFRYETLSKRYKNILRQKPGNNEALVNLGILSAEYGKYSEAEDCFQKILEGDPYDAIALNNIGNVNFMRENYDKAKEYYLKASKADPYDGNIWLNLARVSVKLGKKGDVKTYADKAEKVDSSLSSVAAKIKD